MEAIDPLKIVRNYFIAIRSDEGVISYLDTYDQQGGHEWTTDKSVAFRMTRREAESRALIVVEHEPKAFVCTAVCDRQVWPMVNA